MLFFPNKKSRMYIMIIPIKKAFSGKVIVEYAELPFFCLQKSGVKAKFSVSIL